MEPWIGGLIGIVVGALLGGIGHYFFSQRRDAWLEARASGLLLLADVRALRATKDSRLGARTGAALKTWDAEREAVAHFRIGSYPSGYKAPEWLTLASHFERIQDLHAKLAAVPAARKTSKWQLGVRVEATAAEQLLARFEADPGVFWYVVKAPFRKLFG